MNTGIACPKCKSLSIKATRKSCTVISDKISIRLWECSHCNERFMIANVLVVGDKADKLEEIYEQASSKRVS